MDEEKGKSRIFHLFADILEYPQADLIQTVRECAALIASENPEAGALFGTFRAFVEETPLGGVEEVYTRTFDLNATCYPYVGYHLFGESYKRSLFLLELKKRYRAQGLTVEKELPDHLAVLLRFMAVCDDEDLIGELVREAMLPTLEKILGQSEDTEDADDDGEAPEPDSSKLSEAKSQSIGEEERQTRPYMQALQVLRHLLRQLYPNS